MDSHFEGGFMIEAPYHTTPDIDEHFERVNALRGMLTRQLLDALHTGDGARAEKLKQELESL